PLVLEGIVDSPHIRQGSLLGMEPPDRGTLRGAVRLPDHLHVFARKRAAPCRGSRISSDWHPRGARLSVSHPGIYALRVQADVVFPPDASALVSRHGESRGVASLPHG